MRQVDDILTRVFYHLLAQRTHLVPKCFILFHLLCYQVFLCVLNLTTEVLLEKLVQADLVLIHVVLVVGALHGVGTDDAVGDLRIKHVLEYHTILVDQSGAVLAKVMEYFCALGAHYLAQIELDLCIERV